MSFPARSGGSSRPILAVSALGCLEFLAAGLAVIFAFQEAETTPHIGLSGGRMALAVLALMIALSILGAGLFCSQSRLTFRDLSDRVPAGIRPWLVAAGILAAAVGWISIFSPPYVFGERAGYFLRLRPLLVAAALLGVELWIALRLSLRDGTVASGLRGLHVTDPRMFSGIFLCLLAVWLLMLVSGIGIKKISQFWNPAGVPLTGLQAIGVLSLLCLGVVLVHSRSPATTQTGRRLPGWSLAIAIYLCAVLVWGLTPMQRHYFSLRPAAPSFQPFPFSDARSHDLGALSIINGQGVYFLGFTDKPLYMVFLAVLHLLGGDNYVLLTWLQLAALACIPVTLFLLGRQYHSELLGAALALTLILQQANSIQASLDIDSVNPRLLMTEVPTLLGMVVIAYLLFRWLTTQRPQYALASGAAIGAASLIRANPLFLLPLAGIFAALVLRRQRRLMYRQILLFSAGFIVVFAPWLVTGVDEAGVPWLWVKFQFVIRQRFQSSDFSTPRAALPEQETPEFAPSATIGSLAYASFGGVSWFAPNPARQDASQAIPSEGAQGAAALPFLPRTLSHALHNMAAALLSLPDIFALDTLHQLSQKDPWGDHTWQGDLTAAQHLAAVVNLALLAIGLVCSWTRFRLAGLVPALVFFGYDLSLAVAATSGGRYVVPINWVAYFYYMLGWIAIIDALARSRVAGAIAINPPASADGSGAGASFLPAIAAVAFVALLIPFANVVLPVLVQIRVAERARSELAAAAPDAGAGVQLAYGKVLYPYYHARTRSFSFHLLTGTGYVADLSVSKDDIFPLGALQSGSLGLAGLAMDNAGQRVTFLYVADQK